MSLYKVLLTLVMAFSSSTSCGGAQLTKKQRELCISDATAAEIEGRFLHEKAVLPDGVECLMAPAVGRLRISSHFRDRNHPFRPGGHTGTDYAMPPGTKILAIASGTVTYARATEHDVNIVVVDMGGGWKYQVLHLTEIRVKKGDEVSTGQVIGLSGGAIGAPGSGPCTTGPHLHLSVSYNGKYTNYEELLCGTSSK